MRRLFSKLIAAAGLVLAACHLSAPTTADAGGLNNLPIGDWKEATLVKVLNWAGYSYPLSTRPLKRKEAARLLRQIRDDPDCAMLMNNPYFRRQYDALARALAQEFRELEEWDNKRLDWDARWLDQLGLSARSLAKVGDDYLVDIGEVCPDCFRGQLSLSHQFQAESFFSISLREGIASTLATRTHAAEIDAYRDINFHYHPYLKAARRYLESENRAEFLLEEGYAKLQAFNIELQGGRDHLWWGSGQKETLMLSDNAPGLYMLKLSNFAPFTLPWIFRFLGPINAAVFLAQLEKDRTIPRPFFAGMRLTIYPGETVELGATRTFIFGGKGVDVDAADTWTLFYPRDELGNDTDFNSNQMAALDARLNLPWFRRWTPIQMLTAYLEFGAEVLYFTEIAGSSYFIKPYQRIYIYGAQVDFGRIDFGCEYSDLVTVRDNQRGYVYQHSQYLSGYTYLGKYLGHSDGTNVRSINLESNALLAPDWRLQVAYKHANYGPAVDLTDLYDRFTMNLRWLATTTSALDLTGVMGALRRRDRVVDPPLTLHRHTDVFAFNLNYTYDFEW